MDTNLLLYLIFSLCLAIGVVAGIVVGLAVAASIKKKRKPGKVINLTTDLSDEEVSKIFQTLQKEDETEDTFFSDTNDAEDEENNSELHDQDQESRVQLQQRIVNKSASWSDINADLTETDSGENLLSIRRKEDSSYNNIVYSRIHGITSTGTDIEKPPISQKSTDSDQDSDNIESDESQAIVEHEKEQVIEENTQMPEIFSEEDISSEDDMQDEEDDSNFEETEEFKAGLNQYEELINADNSAFIIPLDDKSSNPTQSDIETEISDKNNKEPDPPVQDKRKSQGSKKSSVSSAKPTVPASADTKLQQFDTPEPEIDYSVPAENITAELDIDDTDDDALILMGKAAQQNQAPFIKYKQHKKQKKQTVDKQPETQKVNSDAPETIPESQGTTKEPDMTNESQKETASNITEESQEPSAIDAADETSSKEPATSQSASQMPKSKTKHKKKKTSSQSEVHNQPKTLQEPSRSPDNVPVAASSEQKPTIVTYERRGRKRH